MQQDTATSESQASAVSTSLHIPERSRPSPLGLRPTSPQDQHVRQETATSDEFGSFVSVDAPDDPLGVGSANLGQTDPIAPSLFDAFADSAKQRSNENEKRVLGRLREHEENPLAWLSSTGSGSDPSDKDPHPVDDPSTATNYVRQLGSHGTNSLLTNNDLERRSPVDTVAVPLCDSGENRPTAEDTVVKASGDPFLLDGVDPSDAFAYGPEPYAASSRSAISSGSMSSLSVNEGPKERAERNKKRILDELHAGDGDPLGWLKPKTENDDVLSTELQDAGSTFIDLSTSSTDVPSTPPRSSTPSASSSPLTSRSPRPSSLPHAISSPLVSLTPDRTQSQSPSERDSKSSSIGSNLGSSIGLSRSWMSSLGLFGTSRLVPASESPSTVRGTHDPPATDAGSAGLSPTQSSLHALFAKAGPPSPKSRRHQRFATEGHSPRHAATMPLPTASAVSSEASPFASHMHVPPSGAPGFTGDHNWNSGGFEFDTRKKTDGKNIRLLGRNDTTVPVLDSIVATALRPYLPPLARLAQSWKLLYSTDQHGLSLNTLYGRCQPPVIVGGGGLVPGISTGALIALQDAEGGVFGAWIPEGIHLSHGGYYGGGDSFLWSIDRKDLKSEEDMHIYKWTGRNGYVAYCDTEGISFGGGDGHYGLYVDASLVEGTTHPCPTFDNECLAHGERKGQMIAFDAVGLEVWGIGS